jgi:putative spermidine/putrescine transport system substrate-binding protein
MAPRDPNKLFRYLRWLDYKDRMRRRRFLKLMAAAGIGTVGVATLAACGDDDNGDDGAPADEPADEPADDTADEPADDNGADDAAAVNGEDIDYTDVEGYEEDGRYEGSTIVVTDFGGAMRDIWRQVAYEPFSQLTGCEIIEDSSDAALLQSQVDSGNVEWTVSQQGGYQGILFGQQGTVMPIDYDIVQRDGLIEGTAHEHAVAALFWSTVLAYNNEQFDEAPGGWADFWDVDNVPGSRGLYDDPAPNLEFALMAAGASPGDLYPLDVDAAFASLDEIRDEILVWWEQGAQPPQLLADGELDMCSAWNGRIDAAAAEGQPVDLQWNQGDITFDTFVVPEGAPEPEIGMDLINFMTRPEVQARMAMLIPYGPVNERSFDYLDEDLQAALPSSPELLEVQNERDIEWWVENRDEVLERWQDWLLS